MSKRQEHYFQFTAAQIAAAAQDEATYHTDRLAYWHAEELAAAEVVKATIGAKLVWQDQTGGGTWVTVIDYGDPAAQRRLGQSTSKIAAHRAAFDRFCTESQLYGTQGEHVYELDTEDVHHYRLGGGPRDE